MSTQPPTPPTLPKKRRPLIIRLLRGLTVLVLSLAVLIPCLYVVEKYRGRAAWRAYETEAKARGAKLDLADFIPPQIPDAENFASIPIFEAAFRASGAKQEVPDPFKLPEAKDAKLPGLNNPTKQEHLDLPAWQRHFEKTKLLPMAGDSAAADVLKALEYFAAPLAQLREAGIRSHCRFPVRWEKAFAAELPHLSLLQAASKIYTLRLSAHLELGDSAAAYEDFRAGLRLTTATIEEPTLVAGLVRIANAVMMENAVWSGLARRQWAEPELRRIEADLATLDWLKDYCFAMGSERGGSNLMIDMIIEHPHQLDDAVGIDDSGMRNALWFYPTGWFYQSKVRANHFSDELVARTDPAQRRFFPDRRVPSSPTKITGQPQRFYYLFFAIWAPVLEDVEKRFIQAATMTDHARLACALERFRLARGTFPETLAELAPEFIPGIPAEIVNGEPYRYRRTEDGSFVLYSIGTDLRDDGGVIDPKASASKQADWVWRYPAK